MYRNYAHLWEYKDENKQMGSLLSRKLLCKYGTTINMWLTEGHITGVWKRIWKQVSLTVAPTLFLQSYWDGSKELLLLIMFFQQCPDWGCGQSKSTFLSIFWAWFCRPWLGTRQAVKYNCSNCLEICHNKSLHEPKILTETYFEILIYLLFLSLWILLFFFSYLSLWMALCSLL